MGWGERVVGWTWRLRQFPGFTAIAKVAGSWYSAPHAEAT